MAYIVAFIAGYIFNEVIGDDAFDDIFKLESKKHE